MTLCVRPLGSLLRLHRSTPDPVPHRGSPCGFIPLALIPENVLYGGRPLHVSLAGAVRGHLDAVTSQPLVSSCHLEGIILLLVTVPEAGGLGDMEPVASEASHLFRS